MASKDGLSSLAAGKARQKPHLSPRFGEAVHAPRLFDDDILVEAEDSSDTESATSGSEADDECDDDSDTHEDDKLDEADRLKDLDYEERLFNLFNEVEGSVKLEPEDTDLTAVREEDTEDQDEDNTDAGETSTVDSRSQSLASDLDLLPELPTELPRQQALEQEVSTGEILDLSDDEGEARQAASSPAREEIGASSRPGPRTKPQDQYRTKEYITLSDEEDL